LNILRNLLIVGALGVLLNGCVLVIPDDSDSSHSHWSHSYHDSGASDRDLAQAVRTSLDNDSQTHAAAISVNAHDGDITLQGTVDDAAVLGRAVALAASTPGVQKVVCELVILKNGSGK
jgi:osmotically-inducible protein OsmY